MTMTRFPDWQERLATLLDERRAMPFSWGTNDCCTLACDAVLAMTGHDPAEGLRAHRSAQEAAEVLRAHGGVLGLANDRLGPAIVPALAQVGDVAMATLDGRDTLVICAGSGWVGPGADGLVWIEQAAASHAWRAC